MCWSSSGKFVCARRTRRVEVVEGQATVATRDHDALEEAAVVRESSSRHSLANRASPLSDYTRRARVAYEYCGRAETMDEMPNATSGAHVSSNLSSSELSPDNLPFSTRPSCCPSKCLLSSAPSQLSFRNCGSFAKESTKHSNLARRASL